MTDPQSPQSSVSWENFGNNHVDYNPKFVTTIDFESRDDAFKWANDIAFENGFALIKANNGAKNRSEKGLLATYFRCKRHGRPPATDDPEKPRRSSKCSCLFRIRAVQNYVGKNDQVRAVWNIVTVEGSGVHNHDVAIYKDGDRHFAGLDDEEKEYVRQQIMAGVLPRDIKSGLHQKTPEKPQPSSTQIYNQTRKVRKEVRGERNTAQQMMALAVGSKYVHWHESDTETQEISHIFMAHPESVKLFRAYHYVVIMDSTYNTNPYKNPVIEMVGVTPTGSSFLIAFAMLPTESEESYTWLLNKLVDILDCMGTTPSVFVTDRELGLINALNAVYPEVAHLLCRWHVNKAINAKALTIFQTKSFKYHVITNDENGWNTVIDAPTEQEFQQLWGHFDGWVDVGDDGHCGFRVVSHAQRGQEDDYTIMTEWCSREMKSDDIYKKLFGIWPSSITGLTGFELSVKQVEFWKAIPCGVDHWMHCDHLLVFATLFNWTICVISHIRGENGQKCWHGSCSSIMPLKTTIEGRLPHGILWIVLYHSHWMRLHPRGPPESVPMPPLNPGWLTYRDQSVAHLDTLYERNIDNWQVYMRSTPGKRRRRDHVDPPVVVSVDST